MVAKDIIKRHTVCIAWSNTQNRFATFRGPTEVKRKFRKSRHCQEILEKEKKQCLLIQNKGNFKHNVQVLKDLKGTLKVVRRPADASSS